MFQARAYCPSAEAYEGAKLIAYLHEQGIGFAQAAGAMDVVVEAIWHLWRAEREEFDDWDFDLNGYLMCDPTVSVRAEYWHSEEDNRSGMHAYIHRHGAFSISIATESYGDDLLGQDELDRLIAFDADRPDELAKFLTLAQLIGGEIEVRNGDD